MAEPLRDLAPDVVARVAQAGDIKLRDGDWRPFDRPPLHGEDHRLLFTQWLRAWLAQFRVLRKTYADLPKPAPKRTVTALKQIGLRAEKLREALGRSIDSHLEMVSFEAARLEGRACRQTIEQRIRNLLRSIAWLEECARGAAADIKRRPKGEMRNAADKVIDALTLEILRYWHHRQQRDWRSTSEATELNGFAAEIYALAEQRTIPSETVKSRLTKKVVVEEFEKSLRPQEQPSSRGTPRLFNDERSWRRTYRATLEALDGPDNIDPDSIREMANGRKERGIDLHSDPVQVALDDWRELRATTGLPRV